MSGAVRVSDVLERLNVISGTRRSCLHWVVPALRDLTGAYSACAYTVEDDLEGPKLGFLVDDGGMPSTSPERHCAQWIERHRRSFSAAYDFRRPERSQRNRLVVTAAPSEIVRGRRPRWMSPRVAETLEHDVATHFKPVDWDRPTARVLLCDGPRLLSYVGITEERRFARHQLAPMRALLQALRDRLVLEHLLLQGRFATVAIDAALEEIAVPAMLLVRKTVHHANAAARELLARDTAPDLRGWDLRRLEGANATLAIRRRGDDGVAPRAAAAAVRWRLTSRQREVLELLATGATNLRIAAELEIAEATVEVHVSRILERAHVDNRAALVAAVWAMS